jgi:multidrug efflux pump subunit AcrA (membrane-fusion protein)
MPREIFQPKALDRLSSPEQLDRLMTVTSPRAWLALGGVGLLVLGALAWGILGKIDTSVAAHGVLTRPGSIHQIEASVAGSVTELLVLIGDEVAEGQELLKIAPSGGKSPVTVASPVRGRVLDVSVLEGDIIAEGAALLTIESPDRPLEAVVYVAAADGYEIAEGMPATLKPATAGKRYAQLLRGKVRTVSRSPVARAVMLRSLRSDEWADSLLSHGPALEVRIELKDSLPEIFSGTPCEAQVIVLTMRPIELLLPTSSD